MLTFKCKWGTKDKVLLHLQWDLSFVKGSVDLELVSSNVVLKSTSHHMTHRFRVS